ncbi:Uncharacterised protein g1666 [Pycnogonum litorale]
MRRKSAGNLGIRISDYKTYIKDLKHLANTLYNEKVYTMKFLYYSLLLVVVLALAFQLSDAKCRVRKKCIKIYIPKHRHFHRYCQVVKLCVSGWRYAGVIPKG